MSVSSCRAAQERDHDSFVIGIESSPATLDPRLAIDAYSTKLCHLIYAGLFRLDENLQLQPHLLESYHQLSPIAYRITLRPQVTFHDGRPVTASDVAWTFNSIRRQEVPSPHFATFNKIAAIEVISDRDMMITLKEPFAPFLSSLTLGILPQGSKAAGIGAGPFRLQEFVPDERVVLTRFEDYWEVTPRPKQLTFKIIRDDNLRVLDLVRGRIDLLQNNVPSALLPFVRAQEDLIVESRPGINYAYMGFNLTDDQLRQAKVRQAFAHALNIPEIIQYKLKGYARPATGILAPMHWAYRNPQLSYPYDPERAKTLLDEAGFRDPDGDGPEPRFRLYYKTSSKRDRVGMARLIAHYLHQVGVEVVVTPYEWGTFFRDIRTGNFQLYSLTWVGVTEPDIYYYTFHGSQVPPEGANRNRYHNAAIDRLTEAGRLQTDLGERKRIYGEVQEIVARELPYLSLWYEDVVVARQRNVKGYTLYPNAAFSGFASLYREESL